MSQQQRLPAKIAIVNRHDEFMKGGESALNESEAEELLKYPIHDMIRVTSSSAALI